MTREMVMPILAVVDGVPQDQMLPGRLAKSSPLSLAGP